MSLSGVAIPLIHHETTIVEAGWILGLTLGRPCKAGKLEPHMLCWEIDEGAFAVGYQSQKAGLVPLRIKINQHIPCSNKLNPFFIQSFLLDIETSDLRTVQELLIKKVKHDSCSN